MLMKIRDINTQSRQHNLSRIWSVPNLQWWTAGYLAANRESFLWNLGSGWGRLASGGPRELSLIRHRATLCSFDFKLLSVLVTHARLDSAHRCDVHHSSQGICLSSFWHTVFVSQMTRKKSVTFWLIEGRMKNPNVLRGMLCCVLRGTSSPKLAIRWYQMQHSRHALRSKTVYSFNYQHLPLLFSYVAQVSLKVLGFPILPELDRFAGLLTLFRTAPCVPAFEPFFSLRVLPSWSTLWHMA